MKSRKYKYKEKLLAVFEYQQRCLTFHTYQEISGKRKYYYVNNDNHCNICLFCLQIRKLCLYYLYYYLRKIITYIIIRYRTEKQYKPSAHDLLLTKFIFTYRRLYFIFYFYFTYFVINKHFVTFINILVENCMDWLNFLCHKRCGYSVSFKKAFKEARRFACLNSGNSLCSRNKVNNIITEKVEKVIFVIWGLLQQQKKRMRTSLDAVQFRPS